MENNCTLLLDGEHLKSGDNALTLEEIKEKLENGKDEDKVVAMKHLIAGTMSGEPMPGVLMYAIRFCCTSNHHQLKKLLMVFWECVEKRGPDGKLLQEMILVCNALRNDLEHPNEYIRGCMLRLCTKLRERELLEPLIPSITKNLEHRRCYVRRNAVLAVFGIYKAFPDLIPDAADLVVKALSTESDLSTKRNAFLMLFHCSQQHAIEYMLTLLDEVPSMGEGFQLVVLELLRKLCHTHPQEKSRSIKCVITLMETASDSVLFECANTLVSVSNAPTAIKAAASCYTQLLRTQSDNNVKLVVLDALADLKHRHRKVLEGVVIDVLMGLQSPSRDVQKRCTDLALDLLSPQNVGDVVNAIKKELSRCGGSNDPETGDHQKMLVEALEKCVLHSGSTAESVASYLLDRLGEECEGTGRRVGVAVRDIAGGFPNLRPLIVHRLAAEAVAESTEPDVSRVVLWTMCQYCSTIDEVVSALDAISGAIGPLPLREPEKTNNLPEGIEEAGDATTATTTTQSTQPTLNADGTYQTQSSATINQSSTGIAPEDKSLRAQLFADPLLGGDVSSCVAKLSLRHRSLGAGEREADLFGAKCMLIIASLLNLAAAPASNPTKSAVARMSFSLRAIASPTPEVARVFLQDSEDAFANMVRHDTQSRGLLNRNNGKDQVDQHARVDDMISFRQLNGPTTEMSQIDFEDAEFADLSRAAGKDGKGEETLMDRLNRVSPLTGFSDPVYVELCMTSHTFDVALDFTLTNKSSGLMTGVLLELSTVGDLRIVERPQEVDIGPDQTVNVHVNVKVSSTKTAAIYGSVVFRNLVDGQSEEDQDSQDCVVLSEIQLDVMDYIKPFECDDHTFREQWRKLEWENAVRVQTDETDMRKFLLLVAEWTRSKCMTPESALSGDCSFLTANLSAKSAFGEDVLINLSLEKLVDSGKVSGQIRVRSDSQGLALGVGDRLSAEQKAAPSH